jgi:hypothetical protein
MGVYLNQLPPAEVARLKAELAETLIANFCYPRFYDYRVNTLRTRPVDRVKRQEVWQYLNAVDFNVWGRVDVDSPDFQRQVERLFIHFVQRNRNFFGPQGRKRMADVRSLITSTSNTLAEGLRGHLRGKQESPPFGSPRPVFTWSTANITGRAEPAWEQILAGTMQLQQQLQELRNEVRPASAPTPSLQPQPPQIPASPRPGSVPSRRPRPVRPVANGAASNGNGVHEDETPTWPPQGVRPTRPSEGRIPTTFSGTLKEAEAAFSTFSHPPTSADAAPTMPLPLNKPENLTTAFQTAVSPDAAPSLSARPRRGTGKPPETSPTSSFTSAPSSGPLRKSSSQHTATPSAPSIQALQPLASPATESSTVLISEEDVVIFEQLRHQLVVWLRVEAVRSGIELSNQGAFQLVETLRQQDGMDLARLQVVSTLLNMCDQIITSGRATLFDYKQAMMFYLMHTRRTR